MQQLLLVELQFSVSKYLPPPKSFGQMVYPDELQVPTH